MGDYASGDAINLRECAERVAPNESARDELMGCLEEISPWKGLETEYSQMKFYEENFSYLEPIERELGKCMIIQNGESIEVTDYSYCVSLIGSLRRLMDVRHVREQILNSHQMTNGLLGDFCDAELFKENPLFQQDPGALQIKMYYDELEVCNPLGSKIKKHKLGAVYYSLGNLHPKVNSTLKSMLLLSLTKYEHVMNYGIDEILKPVVKELQELETDTGVEFMFGDEKMHIRGTLTVFSAVNLAAWAVGGFKALQSAFRRCQYCMVTGDNMQVKFSESDVQQRTKEVHEAHCSALGGPLSDHIATTFGVMRNSILNQLKYFHVTTGLVPDIMHNILEGTLEQYLRNLLIQLTIVDKLFPLQLLNDRISSFCYGPDEVNKPTALNPKHLTPSGSICKSATLMWCLGRYLPILLGDIIVEDNEYWENYLLHLDIIEEVFAPVTSNTRAEYLAMLIEDFLYDHKQLYPEQRITPKMHFLIHLPRWMKWCGPLVQVRCMRYESKHSHFKHLTNVIRNFKNLPKTLAQRHQCYMCYHLLDFTNFLQKQQQCTTATTTQVGDLEYSKELISYDPNLLNQSTVWRVRSATINGTTYKKKQVLVCDVKFEEPIFCEIVDLVTNEREEVLIITKLIQNVCYNRHYHAYEVKRTSTFYITQVHHHFLHHPSTTIHFTFVHLMVLRKHV